MTQNRDQSAPVWRLIHQFCVCLTETEVPRLASQKCHTLRFHASCLEEASSAWSSSNSCTSVTVHEQNQRETDTQTHTQTYRQTHRQTHTHTHRRRDGETGRIARTSFVEEQLRLACADVQLHAQLLDREHLQPYDRELFTSHMPVERGSTNRGDFHRYFKTRLRVLRLATGRNPPAWWPSRRSSYRHCESTG